MEKFSDACSLEVGGGGSFQERYQTDGAKLRLSNSTIGERLDTTRSRSRVAPEVEKRSKPGASKTAGSHSVL